MSRKRQKTKKNHQSIEFMVYEQDLRLHQPVDGLATRIMGRMEGKVSDELLELINQMLLGFTEGMQVEIANDLLIFTGSRIVQTTGCVSADAVLKSCYEWIAAEKGFELEFRNV